MKSDNVVSLAILIVLKGTYSQLVCCLRLPGDSSAGKLICSQCTKRATNNNKLRAQIIAVSSKPSLGNTLYVGKGTPSATKAVLQMFGVEGSQCCLPCAGFALTFSFARPWRGRLASQSSLPPAIQCSIRQSSHMSAINQRNFC